jgi:hypothetical protein
VFGQFISFFSPPEKFPLLPCRAETSRLRTGRLLSDLQADGSSEFLNAKLPSHGEPDPLALRRAFQQLQVFLEQLIHPLRRGVAEDSTGTTVARPSQPKLLRRSRLKPWGSTRSVTGFPVLLARRSGRILKKSASGVLFQHPVKYAYHYVTVTSSLIFRYDNVRDLAA